MFIHWLNGNLAFRPESLEEHRALLLLWKNAKLEVPKAPWQVSSWATTGAVEQGTEGGDIGKQPLGEGGVLSNLGYK